jgi:general secretion pathway protein K
MVRAAMSRRAPPGRDAGAALIAAMLVAALAAAIVATLAAAQSQWLRHVELRRDQVQAQALVQAGLQWARQVVYEDSRYGPIDHLGEPWALPLPPTPIDNGSIEGSIVDAQSRLNPNLLGDEGIAGTVERERFARLFSRLGIPADRLDAVADWVDADAYTRPQGGEDALYRALTPPRVAANAPMLRTAEIASVRGFTEREVAALAPFACAMPGRTALNVNTAPAEVLAAAVPGLAGEPLERLIGERAKKPFATLAEFRFRLPPGSTAPDERTLSLATSFFLVTVIARQGETVARGRALLQRRSGAWPRVVWQTIE